jgi:hypothetical protein
MSKWIRCNLKDGKQLDINFDRVNVIYRLETGCRVDFGANDSVFIMEDADTVLSQVRE